MKYLVSVGIMVSWSKRCAKPSLRTKISFFLSATCTDELFPTSKITAFGKEKSKQQQPTSIPYQNKNINLDQHF